MFLLGRYGKKIGFFKKNYHSIQYITEKKKWSIYMDGLSICHRINIKQKNKPATISNYPYLYKDKIIHFGSQYMWTSWEKFLSLDNKYIVSFYHGKHKDGIDISNHINQFVNSADKLSKIVTASTLIEKRLLRWGISRSKLVKIPIGVDTKLFNIPNEIEKISIRKKFGISGHKFIIGSFQKDGIGWNDGIKPKLIKGPDLFVESVIKIAKQIPISVLLTGPARGFVKQKLEQHKIDFKHVYHKNHEEIADAYKVLDLYLVTSREEGGPKAIVESMASGVPIVSTNVGMASDFITANVTGAIAEMNSNSISQEALSLLHNKKLQNIIMNARHKVMEADWSNVAKLHWENVYKPLIKN